MKNFAKSSIAAPTIVGLSHLMFRGFKVTDTKCWSMLFTLLNLFSLLNFTVLRHCEQYLQLVDSFLFRRIFQTHH